ncbi:NAD(P)H-dependent oxidoreductase [Fictibacillus sp. KU28468]|uniref:NAD(P)H-dependent oxidoreductase n=1 Tax=Fictibacillus sp. KU28468 TaxID=2991053 RepID=UPI00223DA3A9|nr:NAD(P)H-dependent oxidoreductase [Fictibacillus sp. KU28468]UZJ77467.1 NAD(P)H-dependent oxidoreductase [Fictibacillus sp. KU28468]
MNHVILYCHPAKESFNMALLETYTEELKRSGHTVAVRNLYSSGFQPVLTQEEYEQSLAYMYSTDIKKEQELLTWCDCLTLIYPVWWGGMPALLKGYIDRVFSYGFAYELDGEEPIPQLKGKSAVSICTTGTPSEIYEKNGMHYAMNLARDHSIFEFCGMEVKRSIYFGNVIQSPQSERERMLQCVRSLGSSF